MLKVGDPAPDFDLPDAEMEMVNLGAHRGKRHVVVYFYPKDDTPGCTIEAIDFSDLDDEFRNHNTVVIGISMDDCLSHGSFRDKHGLSIQLLADTEGEVCERYGVIQIKENENGKRRCIQRSTFIVDKSGHLAQVMYGVSARGHAAQVLSHVKELK